VTSNEARRDASAARVDTFIHFRVLSATKPGEHEQGERDGYGPEEAPVEQLSVAGLIHRAWDHD